MLAPEHVLRTGDGTLIVADTCNHRVRVVRDGVVSTLLGTGAAGRGVVVPASTRPITSPVGLHVDARGNLWVATPDEVVVVADRDDDGRVDGDDVALAAFAGSDATLSGTRCLAALLGDGDDVLVADRCSGGLVRIQRTQR